MTASPESSSAAIAFTVDSVMWPAGTITQTARGAVSFDASSASEAAPSAPSATSVSIAAGLTSWTTHRCPSRIRRRTMFAPILPRPTIPSSAFALTPSALLGVASQRDLYSRRPVSEPLRNQPAWRELERHHTEIGERHLRDLFDADPGRGERLVAEGAGLLLDYSKNRITDETLSLLVALAEQTGMPERREQMFRGERINVSEDRPVLHVALRMPRERSLVVDGVDVVKQVHEVLDRMSEFARRVRSGEWKGHTGKPIRNVVNVGIGGSDLGAVVAYEALR